MPKARRLTSSSHRQDLLQRPPDPPYIPHTHRTTSIWTASDDEKLIAARAKGGNWEPIAKQHFPNKSGNACRKRHERLMEKRNAEDWDVPKLERLAVEYMAMRRSIWTPLAEIMGPEYKWTNVEAKCMEKGLKNLSALYKSAQRKERAEYIPPPQSIPTPISMTMASRAAVASAGYVSASSYMQHQRRSSYQPTTDAHYILPSHMPSSGPFTPQLGGQQRYINTRSMRSPSPIRRDEYDEYDDEEEDEE